MTCGDAFMWLGAGLVTIGWAIIIWTAWRPK